MKKIIIMGIPHHGNIGDNAIALVEENLIKENFKDYKLYMMQEKYLDKCVGKVKRFIKDDDIILLHGGGNIGDTYERPEKGRREVIKLFPNNKIIIFPQTAYFSNTEYGKKELEISKKIYNNHKSLVILAREKKSYDFMKENFYNAKIFLTPDIVMTLHKKSNIQRNEALLLFRTDKEKTIKDKDREQIELIIKNMFGKYTVSDMNLGTGIIDIGGKKRDEILNEKFCQFQKSKIVVTDRLHGMIFAAITETPCVVFSNFNHKISESYNWINNLEYIKFCNNIDELEECINTVLTTKNINYDSNFAYNMILDILKAEIYTNAVESNTLANY